jgi:hypothetical protein
LGTQNIWKLRVEKGYKATSPIVDTQLGYCSDIVWIMSETDRMGEFMSYTQI